MRDGQEPPEGLSVARCCAQLQNLLTPDFFKALSDPNRLALLVGLAGSSEPQRVSELACCCPVDLSVVSRHLAVLKRAGIVDAHKEGKEVRYILRFDVVSSTLRALADAIDECCPPPSGPQGPPTMDKARSPSSRS